MYNIPLDGEQLGADAAAHPQGSLCRGSGVSMGIDRMLHQLLRVHIIG